MTDSERDTLLNDIRVDVAEIRVRIEAVPDHESRIRGLERFRYAIPGATVVTAIAAALGLTHIFS